MYWSSSRFDWHSFKHIEKIFFFQLVVQLTTTISHFFLFEDEIQGVDNFQKEFILSFIYSNQPRTDLIVIKKTFYLVNVSLQPFWINQMNFSDHAALQQCECKCAHMFYFIFAMNEWILSNLLILHNSKLLTVHNILWSQMLINHFDRC